jgi:hypothetical protein
MTATTTLTDGTPIVILSYFHDTDGTRFAWVMLPGGEECAVRLSEILVAA